MKKSLKALVFLGILCVLFLSGAIAQDHLLRLENRSTGTIPLTAEQLDKVLTTWPRVDRVNFNLVGRERINKVKALKGKTLLSSRDVRAIGREIESSIHSAGTPDTPVVLNETLLGDLPAYADNSLLQYFPGIRDQNPLGSCASFSTTYYQLSYMTALKRGLDISDPDDNTNKYSPKWSYNLLNDGSDLGTSQYENLLLLETHGAATWEAFPYDTNYLAWCLDAATWRNALSVRTEPAQFSWHTDTDAGLEVIKQLLANGYILTYGTYVGEWLYTTIQDDPSTPDDDPAVGKYVACWVQDGTNGGHGMTIVGYNDAIWSDINLNGTIDAGEKGALRIANSWGTGWNPGDGGFTWLAYDTLKSVSEVPGAPSLGRQTAFLDNMVWVMTVRDNYTPSLIAEFTVNHLKRNQLTLSLGLSSTSATTPSTTWTPIAFYQQGGAYAFDGTLIAVDGTFVLDFTDILAWATGGTKRFYLKMADSTGGDTATLSAFKIIDYTTDPDTTVTCSLVPQYADASTVYPYVEHTYTGPTRNTLPVVENGYVTPVSGTDLTTFTFWVHYFDADGPSAIDPPVRNVYIDGAAYQMTYYPNLITRSNAWYYYATVLPVGNHNYRFYFTDVNGGSGQDPITTDPPDYFAYEGPTASLAHVVTTPSTPTGEQNPVMGLPYNYSTSGSACHQGHGVQYQFDWGDGTTSAWLAAGVTTAEHTWNSSGRFSVVAEARCVEDNAIISSWSGNLVVSAAVTPIFSQSFPSSTLPSGWTQQNPSSTVQWSVSNTTHAGGQAYEMRCRYAFVTGTSRLVTPPIDSTGRTALYLGFKHFFDAFGTGLTLKIQSSPDGTTWTDEAWAVASTSANIGPETVSTAITHNVNIATTYIAFAVSGSLSSMDYWYIDDVSISAGALPLPCKADFNNDGLEDILWRYYGEGIYKGFNDIWFLGQSGTPSPMLLGNAQAKTGEMSLLTGSKPAAALPPLQKAGSPRTTEQKRAFKMLVEGGRVPALKSSQIMRNAVGHGRTFSPLDRRRVWKNGDLRNVPARKDAADLSVLSSGETGDFRNVPTWRDAVGVSTQTAGEAIVASPRFDNEAVLWSAPDLAWEIAGTGDFNGDGQTDILWRYYGVGDYQGLCDVWYMNETGTEPAGENAFCRVWDTNWRIDATGDFDRDGQTDILWRYYGTGDYQGLCDIWYMHGTEFQSESVFARVWDTNWRIAATGDFNGDGQTDILWRYYGTGAYQGLCDIWYMNGGAFQSENVFCRVLDTNWEIAGAGDFNKDGQTDILWRYYGVGVYQGLVDVWYMNGAGFLSEDVFSQVPDTNWRIANR